MNGTDETNPRPRSCTLRKTPSFNGFGFNLHAEKGRAGQYIGKVDPGSPAEAANLKQGDRIVEVDNINIGNENHQQVVSRIKASGDTTHLLVVDAESDKYYKENKIVIIADLPEVQSHDSQTPQTNIDPEDGSTNIEENGGVHHVEINGHTTALTNGYYSGQNGQTVQASEDEEPQITQEENDYVNTLPPPVIDNDVQDHEEVQRQISEEDRTYENVDQIVESQDIVVSSQIPDEQDRISEQDRVSEPDRHSEPETYPEPDRLSETDRVSEHEPDRVSVEIQPHEGEVIECEGEMIIASEEIRPVDDVHVESEPITIDRRDSPELIVCHGDEPTEESEVIVVQQDIESMPEPLYDDPEPEVQHQEPVSKPEPIIEPPPPEVAESEPDIESMPEPLYDDPEPEVQHQESEPEPIIEPPPPEPEVSEPEPVRVPTPEPQTPEPVSPEPITPDPVANGPSDPFGGSMSVKEMKAQLAARKRQDIRSKKMDFRDKLSAFEAMK